MEKKDIHIGNLIKARMKEKHLSPTGLAKLLAYSLPGTTSILNRKTMQTDVLLEVCRALEYDFFRHYADCGESSHELKEENARLQKELAELKKENEVLKNEMEYLKKIVRLHEEKGLPRP